jgi:ketosteroid isomerase-like protein
MSVSRCGRRPCPRQAVPRTLEHLARAGYLESPYSLILSRATDVLMRYRTLLASAALLLPFAAAPARAQTVPVPINTAAEARQRFRAESMREAMILLGNWRTAWESHDVRTLARQYDRRALLLLPNAGAPLQGRDAIEEALKTLLPRLGSIQFRLVDSEVGDQLLYLYQEFTLSPPAPDSAGAPPAAATAGSSLLVLERDSGGDWKIRAQTFHVIPASAPAGHAAQADGGDSSH